MNPPTTLRSSSPTTRHLRHLSLARERAPALDVHHAGTAQTGATTELGAGQLEVFPDHPQQRRCRRRIGRRRLAVHSEVDGHGFLLEITARREVANRTVRSSLSSALRPTSTPP